jgi:hypothetical protein
MPLEIREPQNVGTDTGLLGVVSGQLEGRETSGSSCWGSHEEAQHMSKSGDFA